MATAGNSFSSDDQATSPVSDDLKLSTPNRRAFTHSEHSSHPRPGQHLDDADLLTWKRQYANIGLREKNTLSNSADDLSQLDDRMPYQFEVLGQDYNDMEDDEIHFDNGNNYDYESDIHERLKRANEELAHDQTPAELKHRQRVSFDAVVKAVDIVQDPQEHENSDSLVKPSVSPVAENVPDSAVNSQNDNNPVEYTVPLNDTEPREGPTLLQQLKALQFHGILPSGDHWSSTNANRSNDSSAQQGSPTLRSTSNNKADTTNTSDMTANAKNSMVVSINGEFQLQSEDDYIARRSAENRQYQSSDDDEDNDKRTSTANKKGRNIPRPPTQAKPSTDPSKPHPPNRSFQPLTRPKSSDSGKRSTQSNSTLSKSFSDNRSQSAKNRDQRPKSAGVSKSLEVVYPRPTSGVDFEELCRKAAEKKRAELREENRKKKEEEEKRAQALAKAREKFDEWVREKDAERKRMNEEKRMENEEREALRKKHEKELQELREKKYKEWSDRKKQELMVANEFRKLQEEDATASGGSSSSIHSPNRRNDHRAFKNWLRRKCEQAKEEKRQLRLEARRLRRIQRRSIKRFQLQQDLQLAKSFGYT